MKRIVTFGFALLLALGTLSGCGTVASTDPVLANAGGDRDVLLNVPTTLDGTGSAGVTDVQWVLTSKPSGSKAALSGTTTLTPSFTPDVVGDYVVELQLNGGTARDSATASAKGSIVSIGVPEGSAITTRERLGVTEYVIDLGATGASLTAAGSHVAGLSSDVSSDAAKAASVTYRWEQVSGPAVKPMGGTNGEVFQFISPTLADLLGPSDRYKWQVLRVSRNDTRMVFKVTVTDGYGNSGAGTFTVFLTDRGSEIHTATGLLNVGTGTRVTLSGPNLNASGIFDTTEAGSPITDWNWSLTVPPGSSAVFRESGTTTSTDEFPSFVPDVVGLYTVTYGSATGNASASAIKTAKAPGTLTINASEFIGVGTVGGGSTHTRQCATCHGQYPLDELTDVVTPWQGTKHSRVFEDAMDIYKGLAPEPTLWEFHTVGYNKDAEDGGFDDLARDAGFSFPATGLTFEEFSSTYPLAARLANVQCESCHGPGEEHVGKKEKIAVSFSQVGICGQCHLQTEPWLNSGHNSTGVKLGRGDYQTSWMTQPECTRCHTSQGFAGFLTDGAAGLEDRSGETGAFPGVTCAACHDPHEAKNPLQLRLYGNVTMAIDGSTVNAGKAAVCYTCHDGNQAKGTLACDTDLNGAASGNTVCADAAQTADEDWKGGYHYAPQGPMLEGKQALTDLNGDGVPDLWANQNSFHSQPLGFNLADVTKNPELPSENKKCLTCHMAAGPSPDEPGYQHLGGHAFKMRTAEGVAFVSSCQACHPSITADTGFNRPAALDYDGDGRVEGIQDEVRGLLVNLGTLIRSLDAVNIDQASGFTASGATVTEDIIRWAGSETELPAGKDCTVALPADGRANYQACHFVDVRNGPGHRILPRAVWNYNSMVRDGSLGVHNTAYTIQVLQGNYRALRVLMQGSPTSTTYKTDFPNAMLR